MLRKIPQLDLAAMGKLPENADNEMITGKRVAEFLNDETLRLVSAEKASVVKKRQTFDHYIFLQLAHTLLCYQFTRRRLSSHFVLG